MFNTFVFLTHYKLISRTLVVGNIKEYLFSLFIVLKLETEILFFNAKEEFEQFFQKKTLETNLICM